MKIDRDNYEIYFLDYLEGNLPAEETAELLIFVENNPDLKDLIEDNDLIKLEPDQSISFLGKSALKKNDLLSLKISENQIIITLKNCEEYFIRFYENDLIDPEKIVLANFLKENPSFIKEFELFGNTFIKPDLEIVYPFKSKLKRRTILLPNVKRILTISAIAASVLLFSTVYLQYINQPTSSTTQQKIAQTVAGPNTTKKDTKSTISNVDDNRPTVNSVPHTNSMLAAALDKNQDAPTISNRIQTQLPTTLLSTRYSGDLALNQKQIPQSIERRTDFDGVTSTAYFNPDPDAAPLNSDGRIINGKLGYALAQGISQAAGSLARDPEAGRLLNGRILLSDIARLGLKGYNLITDRNLSLTEEYDSTGTKTGYALSDGNRRISRFLNRLGR